MNEHDLPSLTEAVAKAVAHRHRTEAVPLQRAVNAVVDLLSWLRLQGVPYETLTVALARHDVMIKPATLRSLLRRSTQRRASGRPMPDPLVALPGASRPSPSICVAPAAATQPSSTTTDHATQNAAGAPEAREKTENGVDEVFERVKQREAADRQRLEGGPDFDMFADFKIRGPKK
ncbi:hypothetical protein [Azospirillum canadense]|uniref:hypothetical protein n=1 Tax=Azospirillum canadense TaxID=403962 RepID=UPI0022265B07|nr:hypothetical protein [Azospirillum canadense]MCW2239501.1 hypothetical protein [Azospirillum canadense]